MASATDAYNSALGFGRLSGFHPMQFRPSDFFPRSYKVLTVRECGRQIPARSPFVIPSESRESLNVFLNIKILYCPPHDKTADLVQQTAKVLPVSD